jgi:hypothetical protein
VDDRDRQTAEAFARVLGGWGVHARVVEDGLLFDPDATRALVSWSAAELERRNEAMELAERVRRLLLEAVGGELSSRHLDELEAVMLRYELAAQEDRERFGLGDVLDLFRPPPPER